MAYALRYYKEFTHADGSVIRLEIHKKDSTAGAIEIGAVVQGLSLQIQGSQGDVDTPIIKTSLSMTFVDASDLENGEKNGFWQEFYTPDAVLWKVILKARKAQETAFSAIWGGYVTPDSFSETLSYRGSVNIIARDNIGHMQDFPFDAEGDANGMISLYDLVATAWAKIESPMSLNWSDMLTTGGHLAYNTLMNVSAFEELNWSEAVEKALYSYGMVMRYMGNNRVYIGALRFMPHFGYTNTDSVPHLEPVFQAGATRELIPAVRRIEEITEYGVEGLDFPRLSDTAFTGAIERFEIEGNTADKDGIAWTIDKVTSGEGWCSPNRLSMFFNAGQYEFYKGEDGDAKFNFLVCNEYGGEGEFNNGRCAEYSRYYLSKSVVFSMRFGQPYAFNTNGQLIPYYSLESVTIAVLAETNGITYYLNNKGEWTTDSTAILLSSSELSAMIPLSDLEADSVLLKIQIHHIKTTGAAKSSANYIPLYGAGLSSLEAVRERNAVNTNYQEGNNVILNRDPDFAPTFDKVAVPSFIKNGIFLQEGDAILPAPLWRWSGGSEQQMAVWNHLSLLTFYAKPNNAISGTIVNADLSNPFVIYTWKGAEHILTSGNINLLNGFIEGAMLREFARYEDMWNEVQGATLPPTEQNSRTNVEGGASSASSPSTYTATQNVNIGGTGGGGGASYLDELQDVNTEGVMAQSVLYYNGTEWVAQSKATFLKGVTDRLSILERFWYDEEGCLCTDMDVKVKGNIVATGEVSAGGSGEEEQQQGDVYRMFHYKQATPSREWKIAHYLGKFPNVKIVDSLKQLCYGDVFFDDANNIRIVFGAAESGDAYLD